MKKRVFLIVLDSCGAGYLPDAADFGDVGAFTLKSAYESGKMHTPNMLKMGLGNIENLGFLGREDDPTARYGRLAERSRGKDTTTGHWEIAGIISERPMPTYPNGFPRGVVEEFERRAGVGTLCNLPYSGTDVIRDYGEEHLRTGKLIIYTSADSVFQIAANESIVPVEKLYDYCRTARELLQGEHGVGRVIARPFVGDSAKNFTRTGARRDFSLVPPEITVLDAVSAAGLDVISVGKINDIFAGKGVTNAIPSHGDPECMAAALECAKTDFHGLCFINLVDFDMVYGHRRDADGYGNELTVFDTWLNDFMPLLGDDDVLMITADHGCDPNFPGTDHTREYIPLLIWGAGTGDFGTRDRFADIGATCAKLLGVSIDKGNSII